MVINKTLLARLSRLEQRASSGGKVRTLADFYKDLERGNPEFEAFYENVPPCRALGH